jgi:acyl carrier protein
MTHEEVFQKVLGVLKPYVKNETALGTASLATNILTDLKVNSARLVDVVLEFEDLFKIEIADADADKVDTVGDAVRLIEAKLAA